MATVGSLVCSLNVSGQFQLSKMAAQPSEPQVGLEFWMDCEVTAGGTPSLQVHAEKIPQISDKIWL